MSSYKLEIQFLCTAPFGVENVFMFVLRIVLPRCIFMTKVKVTRKYQVTIPKEVRRKVDVNIGDALLVREEERKIILEKPVDIEKLAGSWDHVESTEKFMEEVREFWRTWKMK